MTPLGPRPTGSFSISAIEGFRLSPQQELALEPVDAGDIVRYAVPVPDGVGADAIKAALTAAVQRYEILRTTFTRLVGVRDLQQVIHDELAPAWGLDQRDGEFDVEHGPLLRCKLDEGELVLTAHPACADPRSLELLAEELLGAEAPEDPIQYADYAAWRHEYLSGDDADATDGRAWWQAQARGEPPVSLAGQPDRFLEACVLATVARLTGKTEPIIAAVLDGRVQPDLGHAIGPFAQPVPIRARIEEETTFAEVLDQVGRARADATRQQDYASAADLVTLAGAATIDDQADDFVRRLASVQNAAAADGAQPVSRLPIVAAEERAALIASAAGPLATADGSAPVHHLFEQLAARAPDRAAVAGAGRELSYGELNASANRIAAMLRDKGAARGARVGLCLERTPALLEALLGILKAGAAYLPLNYEHPPARLAHQLQEAGAKVLLTEQHLLERLPEFDGEAVCVDRDRALIDGFPDADPDHVCEPGDLAYVMYTSGSTGLPKGVMVTHGNLANYSVQIAARLGADGSRFGVVSAISTDLGNTCIFPALVGGGCVQLISPEGSMNTDALLAELGGRELDVIKIAPSHLGALLASGASALPRRWLVVGGEALSWELVARIREAAPELKLLNHYGPTEATIGCCAYEVGEERADSATVPIGFPFAGMRAYVLDRALEPVPDGVPGELCLAGSQVALGYVGGAGDAFLDDPLSDQPSRMYRTGDRVRRLQDGAIEFLGRIDDQVKIRGFRIEPAEIESVLARHPAVRQAAVVPEGDERGELRLVAYIAVTGEPKVEDLQGALAQSLPDYMVPGAFAVLDSLPFTPSGKIDRKALPDLASVQMKREAQFVAPRDEIEAQIAGIWAELLGTEQVGVFDDFFSLGGHSLLATQAIMRIRRDHAEIPLRALLAAPTVATLAEVVRGGPIRDGER